MSGRIFYRRGRQIQIFSASRFFPDLDSFYVDGSSVGYSTVNVGDELPRPSDQAEGARTAMSASSLPLEKRGQGCPRSENLRDWRHSRHGEALNDAGIPGT